MEHNKVTLVIRGVEVEHRLNYNARTQAKWRECVVKLETMLENWDALAKLKCSKVRRPKPCGLLGTNWVELTAKDGTSFIVDYDIGLCYSVGEDAPDDPNDAYLVWKYGTYHTETLQANGVAVSRGYPLGKVYYNSFKNKFADWNRKVLAEFWLEYIQTVLAYYEDTPNVH